MKVTVTRDDGTQIDVTEPVRITYDAIRQSMDWGSDFLDIEELEGILALARACDFPDLATTEPTVAKRREIARRNAEARAERERSIVAFRTLCQRLPTVEPR